MWDVWVVDFVTGECSLVWSGVSFRKGRRLQRDYRYSDSGIVVVPLGFRFSLPLFVNHVVDV